MTIRSLTVSYSVARLLPDTYDNLIESVVRHLAPRDEPYSLPRPIIMDSDLRLAVTCKLLKNYQAGTGRRPWIICSNVLSADKALRQRVLEEAGAKVIAVSRSDNGEYYFAGLLLILMQPSQDCQSEIC
jgi:hypothetical protein